MSRIRFKKSLIQLKVLQDSTQEVQDKSHKPGFSPRSPGFIPISHGYNPRSPGFSPVNPAFNKKPVDIPIHHGILVQLYLPI